MRRGAGARRVVEAVFPERLGVSGAADDDTAPDQAHHSPDPARVQGVAEAHDGGLPVGAHREPDGGDDGAEGCGRQAESVTGVPTAPQGCRWFIRSTTHTQETLSQGKSKQAGCKLVSDCSHNRWQKGENPLREHIEINHRWPEYLCFCLHIVTLHP